MLLAIDYDGTYSMDPYFWRTFILSAAAEGHTVILATSRDTVEFLPAINGIAEMIACGPTHKRKACAALGRFPDIWIDDQPETINGPGWLWWQRLKGALKALFSEVRR